MRAVSRQPEFLEKNYFQRHICPVPSVMYEGISLSWLVDGENYPLIFVFGITFRCLLALSTGDIPLRTLKTSVGQDCETGLRQRAG